LFKSVEKQEIKVPANIDYLGDLRDFVTNLGHKYRFSDKLVNAFKLSIDEAATNIIRHAYREHDGEITVRALIKRNSLTLSIIDQGKYFDPKRVKDPDLNRYINIGKKGGLGIFIIRRLMDEIDYHKTEEGNELRITKYREGQALPVKSETSPEKKQKKDIFKSVSQIPFSIKAKYFLRAFGAVAAIITIGYLYYFLKTDDELTKEFLRNSRVTNNTIVNRISSSPPEGFEFIEDIVYPIDQEYEDQLFKITVQDSTGLVSYSTNVGEIFSPFSRPVDAQKIQPGLYQYSLNGEKVYEFESELVVKRTGEDYGTVHILFSFADTQAEITAIRKANFQLALLILGLSGVGVALLIYLVLNPFRKLSEWVRNLGHGDMEDEMDIDDSSEIGEIAKAFSDITHKFRDSQKNLADHEQLKKDMHIAQQIQQTLLPAGFPELEGYDIAAFYEAAKDVGGDYYDFVEVDKDTLGIVVADVSGKSVGGALVMTMIRQTLRTEARGIKDAAEVLSKVNRAVKNDIKQGMFVTIFYLIIDSKKRSLNYASAGHNPMILYRASTRKTFYLNPKGYPIGVKLPEDDYFDKYIESETVRLAKDDILILYTDGITEAMNHERELFSEERLQLSVYEHGSETAAQFVEDLKNDIYGFTSGHPQNDDITLVAVKENVTREEDELRRAKEVHQLVEKGKSIRDACESVNLTTYAYYNKYKKVFDEEGIDAFEIDESSSVEANHISIEDKTKIFDIVRNNPEYGASRIKDELNTEKYGFTNLTETRIYDELVRHRLNTKAKREVFVSRVEKSNRKFKPPGTPLLTITGEVVINKQESKDYTLDAYEAELAKEKTQPEESEDIEFTFNPEFEETTLELPGPSEDENASESDSDSLINSSIEEVMASAEFTEIDDDFDDPLEDETTDEASVETSEEAEENQDMTEDEDEIDEVSSEFEQLIADDDVKTEILDSEVEVSQDDAMDDGFSFEELFAGGSIIEPGEDEDALAHEETTESQATDDVDSEAEEVKQETESTDQETPSEESVDSEIDYVEEEDTLTVSSVDELLNSDEPEEDFEDTETEAGGVDNISADKNYNMESASDEAKPYSNQAEESVSFSDLIQAIDDELVYISEPGKEADGKKQKQKPDSAVKSDTDHGANGIPDKPAVTNKEDKELVLLNGIKYYKNSEYDKAIQEFKKVINMYPDYKEAHSILGNAYFRSKKYKEAEIEYQKVKEIDPTDVTAYENMGVIFANRGNYKDAVGEWEKVMELSPNRSDIEDKIKKASKMI